MLILTFFAMKYTHDSVSRLPVTKERKLTVDRGCHGPPSPVPTVSRRATIAAQQHSMRSEHDISRRSLVLGAIVSVLLFGRIARAQPPAPGTVEENPKDQLKYVYIPPGTFMMGCSPGDSECADDERPAHRVVITRGIWLGQTEVTVGAYKRFIAARGHAAPSTPYFKAGSMSDALPVDTVSWDDVQAYCRWAGGRLPTQAEWEYAARAGSTESRYGEPDEIAWTSANSGNQAHEVAQKRPNAWGLFDMLGNVWEWVEDWYGPYSSDSATDPHGPSSGSARVLRGGSWILEAKNARASRRSKVVPNHRSDFFGFRCARELRSPIASLPGGH